MPTASQFEVQIKAFESRVLDKALEIIQKVAFYVLSRIILESPFDTGLFRSSWVVKINADESLEYGGIYQSKESAARPSMERSGRPDDFKLGDIIEFANNTEYGVFIEYGSPKKEAVAMVRMNTQLMQDKLNEAFKAMR